MMLCKFNIKNMACNNVPFDPQRATKPYSILNNPKVDFMQTSDQVLARLQVPSQWSSTSPVLIQKPYVTQAFTVAANQNSGTSFCRQQDVGKVAVALGTPNAPTNLSSPSWVVRASPN
jgi:hypothetical protein